MELRIDRLRGGRGGGGGGGGWNASCESLPHFAWILLDFGGFWNNFCNEIVSNIEVSGYNMR